MSAPADPLLRSVGGSVSGASRVFGVLGFPVAQSLSPAMHNAAFAAVGLEAVYVPFPVQPAALERAVRGLAAAGVGGFNLTVPHKTAILSLLDEVLPAARRIGAVNTVRCGDGGLTGTNTDGLGLMLSLRNDLSWDPGGKHVLMVGAGGAARGIALSLLESGVERLVIANRTRPRAEELAARCAQLFPDRQVEAAGLEGLDGSAPDLLLQTTTVGMGAAIGGAIEGSGCPLAPEALGVREAVIDIIYHPAETPLLARARALGLPTANGIGMLLYQGAEAFRFWTGHEPPVEVMRQALLANLAARER